MAKLTTKQRKALPDSDFALPKQRKYPIPDKGHAKAALARVAEYGSPHEKHVVRDAVYKRYPSMRPQG